jgi:response regulator RpfG family c-di-GMP phosphodiesterase
MHPTGNLRLLDKMASSGLITAEQRESVLSGVHSLGERFEEAILDRAILDEAQLLRFLATEYQTRFVSTDKLAKANIDRSVLQKVPQKFAEQRTVFPIMLDAATSTLSIVTPDPDDPSLVQELKVAGAVKQVQLFVGRPRAVKAAITKAYNGDIHAFATLDRGAHEQFTNMLNVYERNLVSEESMATSLARESVARERVLTTEDLESNKTEGEFMRRDGVSIDAYQETLNVLLTLLESGRGDLRGHSTQVVRLMRKLAERIGVSDMQKMAFVMAAQLHDVGKMGTYHLTPLNVAEYEGHRAAAKKQYLAPIRLMEAVHLPREFEQVLASMYERYDGSGFPNGAEGKEIPLGARVLALAETYADLTQNVRNPFRKVLTPVQACEALKRYSGTIFDPNLVDIFRITITGDDLKARLLANRYQVLLIDPDPEETTVLELRLFEQGFDVRQAHSGEPALKLLATGEFELVVSELDIGDDDGLKLLATARKTPGWREVPWIILTNRSGRSDAQRAFDLGVADFLTKPVSADLFVAKAKQILERQATAKGARGVTGSLQEMGLPEIVQILFHGRKTGRLRIRSKTDAGEIHFVSGDIYNALWSTLRGEEAFYAMLNLTEGDFALDPNFKAPQQVIQGSPEALLLEGMRRMDESGR